MSRIDVHEHITALAAELETLGVPQSDIAAAFLTIASSIEARVRGPASVAPVNSERSPMR